MLVTVWLVVDVIEYMSAADTCGVLRPLQAPAVFVPFAEAAHLVGRKVGRLAGCRRRPLIGSHR